MFQMRVPYAILAMAILASCKNGDDSSAEGEYCDPVANAGEDLAVLLGANAPLDGSQSTACLDLELSYTWTFEQVPVESAIDDVALGTANGTSSAVATEFLPDVVGTYVVSLTVNDGVKTSNPDLVVITVSSDNLPPTADAGPDVAGEVGTRVALDGSGSRDPEGVALEYVWTLASTPSGSTLDQSDVYDGTTASASIVPDKAGIYVLSLVVSDGISWSEPDYVSVTVASENQAPISDAGDSKTLPPCEDSEVELNGWGSYDPDGDSLTYVWSLVSAPSGSSATDDNFDDVTKPNPKFNWDVTGNYTFSLEVSDGKTWSATDVVTFTMVDITANRPPVANAGDNQTVETDVECSSSSYVWTCPPCDPVDFAVDGTASSDANGDSLSYFWSQSGTMASGSVTIASPYTAWTEVMSPAVSATYGSTTTHDFELTLEVADCADVDTDVVKLTVTCEGTRP
jgi:hypothetical protein